MAKMTIRFILKSGAEFTTKCDAFTLKQNALGVAGYDIKGITEGKPVYIDFETQAAAIVRTYSDERQESEGSDE